ncbi:plasmid partitioning protein RepB C-terminal domain-containing protein [Novosphingobium guangzhouense]|uniref:Chromosome partitioning protein ParB n=1 Tax=Novosphingobium guangzhouense TaxID=1850347 RepID=A0A2K2FU98_9SPHN|nr:plasmid partitioning protein RepB C-terminal domain-containing protein [Novosphingobium guangzhouense]PNU02365.1 chromosome partitioning protein ParB [Novosphingobium guangzhouense]
MRKPVIPVKLGFEEASLRIALAAILPLRDVTDALRKTIKYNQIAASISEVGIIEPPVVVRDAREREKYHLLDGHLRVDILRTRGEHEVVCLIATDDEAFTYNRRVSRIAAIQEHKMILNAIKKGVSEERLARALNVNIDSIRHKRNLLVGICPEVADLLQDRHVPLNVFGELRRLKPIRQIEAAQAMIAMIRFSLSYAKGLVASTPDEFLVAKKRNKPRGLTTDQIAIMQRESENLDREFKVIEQRYGEDHLDLVVAIGYVGKLLSNARVVRHMAQQYPEILSEFQKHVEFNQAA